MWEANSNPGRAPVRPGFYLFVCAIFVQCRGRLSIVAPNTGQNVQGWSADEGTDDDDTYQSFQCIACTRAHLVNLKTGKVLGEEED